MNRSVQWTLGEDGGLVSMIGYLPEDRNGDPLASICSFVDIVPLEFFLQDKAVTKFFVDGRIKGSELIAAVEVNTSLPTASYCGRVHHFGT